MAQPLSVFFSPEDVQVQELIEEAIVPVAVYYTLESLKYVHAVCPCIILIYIIDRTIH
jgi:hypothetical protein